MPILIHGQEAVALGVDIPGGGDQIAFRPLTDGDNDAGAGIELLRAGNRGDLPLRTHLAVSEDDAVLPDFQGALVIDELHPLQPGIAALILAGGEGVRQVDAGDEAGSVADGGAGAVHGAVSRADHDDPLSQAEGGGRGQIVDGIGDMTQAFPPDVQLPGLPETGADKDALEAVTEEIVNGDGAADIGVGAELNALQLQMAVGQIVQDGIRQAEIRDAIAEDAADLVPAVKDRDLIAVAGKDDGNGDPRGPGSDDGGLSPVGGLGALNHLIGVGGGDIAFNDGEMNRSFLDAADAMALALVFMIADQGADRGQGIVLKEHPARVVEAAGLQEADHLGNIGMNRAAFLAAGLLAAQAAVGFFHHMQRHGRFLHSMKFKDRRFRTTGAAGRESFSCRFPFTSFRVHYATFFDGPQG